MSAILAISVYERFVIEREMAARRAAAEAELVSAQERKAVLEEKVEYLSAEHGVESEIRRHFDVARDGEQVVVLVGEPAVAPAEAPSVSANAEKRSGFWAWLFSW